MSEIKLSPEAFGAVMSSVLTGPNCTTRGSLVSYGVPKKAVLLSSLSEHLDEGPDTFIAAYVATSQKFKRLIKEEAMIMLDEHDIAMAYCLNHISMVWVGERKFMDGGASNTYFSELEERGFVLSEAALPSYLYSCIGKPGKVTSLGEGFASVSTGHCALSGIVVPEGTAEGDWVVVHFATAITLLSEKQAKAIQEEQQKDSWFKTLEASCPGEIDYCKFCGGNLSAYAKKRIGLFR